ncbi:cytidine deaminase [Amycolatopsis minnesotensis]|uniref:Cytidine deaminase n=1 Tax=Amycolatopsis minnesotensis TaxID=337894 RepID=A0ABN2QEK3_9PSEU
MPESAEDTELTPEDEKIVVLARSARARTQAVEGAAVRDTDGRTYAASTVDLPSFKITALQAAIAAAVSSGADGIEAAAVVSTDPLVPEASVQAVRDLSKTAPIFRADASGAVEEILH